MYNARYINNETLDSLEYLSGTAEQRERYILKTLSSKHFDLLKKKLPFTSYSKARLSDLNPLLPKGIFDDTNRDVAFIRLDNQKYSNIGFVMLGEFHSNADYSADAPDSLSMYLAKFDSKTKEVTLWRNLKTTPGFQDVYKFGESFYVQKQRIVPGGSGDNRGSMSIETNPYEMLTATRDFFSKAQVNNSVQHKIIKGMLENDYLTMDIRPIYKKADRWSTKMNELASGKLENVLFTASQINDADFLHTNTNMGEQYLVNRKLNNKVFEDIAPIFRRNSGRNRVNFLRDYDIEKKNYLKRIADGEELEPYGMNFLTQKVKEFNSFHFRNNLDTFSQLNFIFNDNDVKGKNYSLIQKLQKSNEVRGRDIRKLISNTTDYLGKGKTLENLLYAHIEKSGGDISKFNDYKFDKKILEKMVNDIEISTSAFESYIIQKMDERIDSKIGAALNDKFETITKEFKTKDNKTYKKSFVIPSKNNKYSKYLYNVSKDDYKDTLGMIERDFIREFYDRYNEKFDLYELMIRERRGGTLSEVEAVADRVEFIYKDGIKKEENLESVNIFQKRTNKTDNFTGDADLKWGYYKARIKMGSTKFDKLSMKERINLSRKYIDDNKELFDRLSKPMSFSKYDDIENFRKLSGRGKYDALANAAISRTNDKILAKINTNDSIDINGGVKFGDKIHNIHININKDDGFSKNDYIKEIINDRQASFKNLDADVQIEIEKTSKLARKVYKLNKLIHKADELTKGKEHDKLIAMQSFLQGQSNKSKTGYAPIWGMKDGELIYIKGMKDTTGIQKLDSYNRIYDEITKYMKSKYGAYIGYGLYDTYRDFKYENMKSLTEFKSDLLIKLNKKLDNTTFMAILNEDQIINTSGASKQQSLIKGNSYLGHLGFVQPGLAWNKVTQRTFQAQDLLGEQTIGKGDAEKTVSEINAEIIKRLGFSGVDKRVGKYTTEELYKEAINRINKRAGLNNTTYKRGEVYKTFAIGDVNSTIGNGLNSFTASFQEGMTAAKSMILTTNSVRNKQFNLNIEEIDWESLGYSKKQLHDMLTTQDGLNNILSKILSPELYGTIEGRSKYEKLLLELGDKQTLDRLDGSYNGLVNFYEELVTKANVQKTLKIGSVDSERNRMRITNEIYKIMNNLRETTGSVAKPTTSQGKNIITNSKYVKTSNELKPELGFTIKDFGYNAQTKNIELMLENVGINTQGSKGQTTGAKFTISEIYDFLKLRSKGRDFFIDAIFNNKAEKRTQTGMIMHTALQTVFTNIHESAGVEGVEKLKENMSDLLKDMNVMVNTTDKGYTIDERYLTRLPHSGKTMTVDEFEKLMKEPTVNTGKLFTERGKKIIDNLIDKYSASYFVDGKETKAAAHVGIVNAMNKAYVKTFEDLGISSKITPFITGNASITGYSEGVATEFGQGSFLLLKLASERVNSTSSKKKESALKISREMMEMLRISGYTDLVDYVDKKNTKRLTGYLGDVYNNMNNSDILKEAYRHKADFDISQLNQAMSETLRNGVMFNLDALDKNDYLLDESDIYLKNSRFLTDSELGRQLKAKGLHKIEDGKLSDNVNVVVNDSRMNTITKDIKKSLDNVRKYYSELAKTESRYSDRNNYISKTFEDIQNFNFDKMFEPEVKIQHLIDALDNPNAEKNISVLDRYRTSSFLNLLKKNVKKGYSVDQLKTIMQTGNIVTTINLGYDIDEATGQIVPSRAFSKLRNIARKNFEYSNISQSSLNMRSKFTNNDKTLVEDIYSGLIDYYSGKKEFSDVEMYDELVRELNFGNPQLTKISNINNRINKIQSSMRSTVSTDHLKKISIAGLDNFLEENYYKLNKTKDELTNIIKISEDEIAKLDNKLVNEKSDILKELQNVEVAQAIKSKLHNTIFGGDSGKKDFLINKRKFTDFFGDKIQQQFQSGFNLLSEYISAPTGSETLFTKKGPITSAQKFKINSSFVANPLEGSNLLHKFEELMFYKVKDKYALEKNISQFKDFLGADIVNENLFKDEQGINILDELGKKGPEGFKKGLEKVREIFSKNLANISEVTITDKRYTSSFRTDSYNWSDLYTGKDINAKGFVRELGFFARHPQQTINHMGAVVNITIDRDNKNLRNKFARAALTYLPQEKNNAGIVTLGKKTMLYRRGDHDGDKVQLALLDFIEDKFTKRKTKSRAYLDFQIKNNILGVWNEAKGRYDSFTGNVLLENKNAIGDLSELIQEGKVISLKGNRQKALDVIQDVYGMNEEELNMHTKAFNVYSHAVYERAKKEFNKHYNAIYETLAEVTDSANQGFGLNAENLNQLEGIVNLEMLEKQSSISKRKIKTSQDVVNALKRGAIDVSNYVNDMDLVSQTAIKIMRTTDTKGMSSQDLYAKAIKDIDKFITRGDFDKFYSEKSAKGVFDELTGIRNTGLTHGYATKLRMAASELSKINPTEFMAQLGDFKTSNLDVNILADMKQKQRYYSKNIDLFVDNMIESAISAKHGLTLGGLEGSKIFINELLNFNADSLNSRIIKMYDDTFIKDSETKTVNLLENIASYKKMFDERSGVLDDVVDKLTEQGLNEQMLYKYLDLGESEFKTTFKDILSENDIKMYSNYAKSYQSKVSNIEVDMFKHLIKDKYVDQEEFRIFQGLNLFGELLIQNDPGLEYDVDEVMSALQKYHNKEISYKTLLKNKDIINLKAQAMTSLGSAASISNVGKLREYLSAFVSNKEYSKLQKEFDEFVYNNKELKKILSKYNTEQVFTDNFSLKEEFANKLSDDVIKKLEMFPKRYNKMLYQFDSNVASSSSDPMGAFLEQLNKNYTLFSSSGKDADKSLQLLKEFKENGLGSVNESSLSRSINNIDKRKAHFLEHLVTRYSQYDSDFENFNLDDVIGSLINNPDDMDLRSGIINELNDSINNALFNKAKRIMSELKIGNSSMTKIRIADTLTKDEQKLKEFGKLFHIIPEKMYNENTLSYMFKAIAKQNNKKFILDDTSIFYKDGKFDKSTLGKVSSFAKDHNLYFSEKISKMIFNSGDLRNSMLTDEERFILGQDLLNARKYLGESFTEENVLKRMSFKFDIDLATKTAVSRFINDNQIPKNKEFENKLYGTLKNIISDFKKVDNSITNNYINPNYIEMAKTYVDSNKEYKTINSEPANVKRFASARRYLSKFIRENREWLEKNDINGDLFSKMAMSELTNQNIRQKDDVKKMLINIARIMTDKSVSDVDGFKFNPELDSLANTIVKNKKYGLAALIASGVLAAGGQIVKPFFTRENGVYTLSNNGQKLTEKEVLSKLNFGNGLKTNMLTEELKGVTKNVYVDVKESEFF